MWFPTKNTDEDLPKFGHNELKFSDGSSVSVCSIANDNQLGQILSVDELKKFYKGKEIQTPIEMQTQFLTSAFSEAQEGLTLITQQEGMQPTLDTTFYTLEQEKIKKFYREKKEHSDHKKKDNTIFQPFHRENSSAFIYHALKAGGINHLSEKCASLEKKGNFAIQPKDLAECITSAKQTEQVRLSSSKVPFINKQECGVMKNPILSQQIIRIQNEEHHFILRSNT